MFGRKTTISDDRQKRVPVLDLASAHGDQELVEMIGRFAESSATTHNRLWWNLLLWVLGFVAAVAGSLLVARIFPGFPPWASGMIWPVFFVSLGLVAAARRRERHVQRLVEGLLHIGRCPSCGYRLTGLPHESDGAIVCPECSASWHGARVGSMTLPLATHPGDGQSDDASPTVRFGFRWVNRTPTVLDARERPLPLVNLWARDDNAPLDPATRSALRAKIAAATFVPRLLMSCGIVLISVLFIAIIFMNLRIGRFAPIPLFSSAFITLLIIVYWMMTWRIWTGRGRRTAPKTRDIIVRHGLCASCGTPLEDGDSNGPRSCPKCRAEWSLARR